MKIDLKEYDIELLDVKNILPTFQLEDGSHVVDAYGNRVTKLLSPEFSDSTLKGMHFFQIGMNTIEFFNLETKVCSTKLYVARKKTKAKEAKTIAFNVLKPPFKYVKGYIYDSQPTMVADDGGLKGPVKENIISRLRGWGHIQYTKSVKPEDVHDEVGNIIAEALNEYYEKRAGVKL